MKDLLDILFILFISISITLIIREIEEYLGIINYD